MIAIANSDIRLPDEAGPIHQKMVNETFAAIRAQFPGHELDRNCGWLHADISLAAAQYIEALGKASDRFRAVEAST